MDNFCMKSKILIFCSFFIGSDAFAKISELNFQPKRGEVFVESSVGYSFTDFLLDFDATRTRIEQEEAVLTQTVTVGVYDSLSFSVDLPFLFEGSIEVDSGGELDLASSLRRSVFRATYNEVFTDRWTLFLGLSFQEAENTESPTVLLFTPSFRYQNGKDSLLISGLVANYSSTDSVESYLRFAFNLTSQIYFGYSFFLRGSIGVVQDTDQNFRGGPTAIVFKSDLAYQAEFSLGYELKEYNLYFLLGSSVLEQGFEPEALGMSGEGDFSALSYFFRIGALL
jgi:hypothetical protein